MTTAMQYESWAPPVEGVRPSADESAAAIRARIRADLHEADARVIEEEDVRGRDDIGAGGLAHDVLRALAIARVGVAIDVAVPEHGVVVLSGTAPSDIVRLHIADLAQAVPGIELVHNEVGVAS